MVQGRAKQSELDRTVEALRAPRGLAIVVSAPSGTGKTTVCERLVAEAPGLSLSVSFTTRKPRKGEKNGEQYYFVTKKQFECERSTGRFLEWAEVYGCLYGTPRDLLEERVRLGRDTVLDIDVQGARSVRQALPSDSVLIFLLPPSLAELKRRLKGRSSDSPESVSRRLKEALTEFGCHLCYDYLVVNEDVDETVEKLGAIITAERCRTGRMVAQPRSRAG